MYFTRRLTREIPRRPLRVQNGSIPWSNDPVKYLGIVLDKRLTFKHHVDYVIKKADLTVRTLYPLICRKSRLSVHNKLMLYKMVIRPILCYACPVFQNSASCHISKLQIFQNKLLRMCLDMPIFTPITELHDIANIQTVAEHINALSLNFSSRV